MINHKWIYLEKTDKHTEDTKKYEYLDANVHLHHVCVKIPLLTGFGLPHVTNAFVEKS